MSTIYHLSAAVSILNDAIVKSIQKNPIEIILPVHDIHVPSYFLTPSFDKIKRAAEYYDLHGHFMPIVVSFHYSKWYVRDGYTNLLAAKRFGLEQVAVQYSQYFHFTNEDLLEEVAVTQEDLFK
ncbi:hypothetical protein D3C74_408930 [compost metagenome]